MIRKLFKHEYPDVAKHLKRFNSDDRRLRFGCIASDSYIDDYVSGIHYSDAVFGIHDDDLNLVGSAHVGIQNSVAELGLSVEQEHRGKGYGTLLLNKSIEHAKLMQANVFTSQCLNHNRWVLREMTKRGFHITRDYDSAIAEAELSKPDLLMYQTNFINENIALTLHNTKLWFKLLHLDK